MRSSPTYAPQGAGELRSATPSASLCKPWFRRALLSHTSNVDFTNTRPQVLLQVVLHTVAVNADNRKSVAGDCHRLIVTGCSL